MFEPEPDTTVEIPFPIVSGPTNEALEPYAPLYQENYRGFKQDFIKWLLRTGKDTTTGEGYATDTARATHYRIDHAYRWKWEGIEEPTTTFSPEDADAMMDVLKRTTKPPSELAKYQKALKRLFKYKNDTQDAGYEWDPDHISDKTESLSHHYFEKHELGRLYSAAIKNSSFKSYHNKGMSSAERDRLKAHLAQRLGKPKSDVTAEDFKEANSWKMPSLLATTFDAGLRPIEVKRARMDWIDFRNEKLVIPKEESSKGEETWEVGLASRTVRALKSWKDERASMEKYHGRDEIWLTKYGNPYSSGPLNRYLNDLIEEANIQERNRDLTWYSIRRGVATIWADEEGIHHAKEQLRHKEIETTERYVNSSGNDRAKQADSKW